MKDTPLTEYGVMTVIVIVACIYFLAALLLTCGCSLHVGDEPCMQYAKAVEERLRECGMLADPWYLRQLDRVYSQCDDGPFGLTFVTSDVDACVDRVRATSCERLEKGAPTCVDEVKL